MLNKEDLERIPEDAKYIFFNEDGSVRSALFGQRVSDRIEDIEKVNPDIRAFYEDDYEGFLVHHFAILYMNCLLYTSPSPRDRQKSRMPSSA